MIGTGREDAVWLRQVSGTTSAWTIYPMQRKLRKTHSLNPCHPEQVRGSGATKGEPKDPEDDGTTMPLQGVFSRLPALQPGSSTWWGWRGAPTQKWADEQRISASPAV